MTDRSLATECPICLEVTFDELTGKCPHGPVADLPCRHLVHVSCLEEQARILHGHGRGSRDRGDRGDRGVGRVREGGDVPGTWTVRREEDHDRDRPNGGGEDDDEGGEGGVGRMVHDLEEGRAEAEADDDDSSSSPPGLLPHDSSDDEEYEADYVVDLTGAGAGAPRPQPQRLALPRRTLTGSGLFVPRRRRPQYHWGQRVPSSRPRLLVDRMAMALADDGNEDDEEEEDVQERSGDDGHGHVDIVDLTSDPGGGIDEEDATAGIDGDEEADYGDMPELLSDSGGIDENSTAGMEEEGQPGEDDGSSSSSSGYSSMPELISDPSSSSSDSDDEDTTDDEDEDSNSSSEDEAAGDSEGGSRSGGSSSGGYTDMPELISYPGSSGSSSDSDYLDTTTDDEEDDLGRPPSEPLVLGGYVLRGSLSAGSPSPEDEDGDGGAGDAEDDDGTNGGEDDHDLDDMPSLMPRNDDQEDDESGGEDDHDLDDMPSLTSRNISDDEDDDDSFSSDDDDDDGPIISAPVGTEIATMSRELEEMIRMREEYIFHIRDLIRLDHDHHHNFEFSVGGGRSRSRFGGSLGPGETCCPTCRHPVNLADVVARDHVAHLSAYWVGRIEFALKVLGVGKGCGRRRTRNGKRCGRRRECGVPLDRLVRFLRAADATLPTAIRDEYLDLDRLTASAELWGSGDGDENASTTMPGTPFETALFEHRGGVSYGIAETSDRTVGGRSKGIWAVVPGQRRRRQRLAKEGSLSSPPPPSFWLYEWDPVPPGSTCRSCGRREGACRVTLTAEDDEASSAHRHTRAVTGVAGTTHVSLGACSGCLESRDVAYYCGVECQRIDRSRHRRECRRFRSLRAGGLRPDLR